jgi:hypothetical protein
VSDLLPDIIRRVADDQYQEAEGKQECCPTRSKRCHNDRTLHVGLCPTSNSNMSQVSLVLLSYDSIS